MKVAMVTPFPDHPLRIAGGVAGAAKYLIDELAKDADVDLTVVVPQGAGGSKTVCEQWGGVRVCRLAREGFWKFLPGTVYDLFAGRRQVRRLLRELEPDVVHFQGEAFHAAGCRRAVLTIHGIAEADARWARRGVVGRWLKRLLLKATEEHGRRRTSRVILINDCVRRFLPENGSRRVWRIDNPVPDSFFATDWKPETGRILSCSRITPLKNIAGLIEAFGLVVRSAPACRLRIAGSGEADYVEACRRMVDRAGLGGSVSFLGGLGVEEVCEELSRASCFVTASFQETAPLSVSEAMAVGVPVVASGVGGIPGMIEHGKTGLLVDPLDAEDIAAAIDRIRRDGELARSMSRAAKALARERCMASAVAEKTLRVYREIAAGNS